eukprot:TRINITY_DN81844_c0_g1_i1.p1 TRINITY_DN81844_c0_g1~~TRINITY_DN81844_c0_g1_i1.p1  ORF type:complete len:143 (-),score=30.69 TRINITY_DN81844_c0_g1_i1:71-478(-)
MGMEPPSGMQEVQVRIKLVFANDDNTAELTLPVTAMVKDVKKDILENHWPASLLTPEDVDRLRLFANGKEIGGRDDADNQCLRDMKVLVNPVNAAKITAVHVQPVPKAMALAAAAAAADDDKSGAQGSRCACSMM